MAVSGSLPRSAGPPGEARVFSVHWALFLAVLLSLLVLLPGSVLAQPATPNDEVRLRIGDILTLSLPGEPALNGEFPVDRRGRVVLPEVGAVDVAGRTLPEANTIIRNALARAYRNISPLAVTLKERRLFITVLGYVAKPGEVDLPADSTVQEAISAAGGLIQGAQLDKFQVRRGNRVIVFDYKRYLDTGDPRILPTLQPLDTIFIPSSPATGNVLVPFDSRTLSEQGDGTDNPNAIKVFGEVNRPGSFAYKDGMSVVDMIMRAGGVTRYASIDRIRVIEGGEPKVFNMRGFLDTGDTSLLPRIQPGATIFVPKEEEEIRRSIRTVYVIGEVNRPGAFEAPPDSRLIEILANAGGPTRYADTTRIRILKADGGTENFNLSRFSETGVGTLPEILPGDAVYVPEKIESADRPSWLKIAPQRAVEVIGAVTRPGRYEWSDEMSLLDLIGEAGGPTQRGDLAHLQIVRARGDGRAITLDLATFLSEGGSISDLPKIQAGDVVRIPELPSSPIDNKGNWVTLPKEDVIYIMGQVSIPGRYAFNKNMTFLDILTAANGPTQSADLRNVRISHRGLSGSKVTQVNLAQYFATGDETLLPKVRNGDVIFVPDRQNKDWFEDPKENTVRVLGSVAKPGRYRFVNDMTLLDLLAEAGGPTADAYQQKIVVVNLGCCREQARLFNLVEFARTGDITKLPVVQAGDTVYIPNASQSDWKVFTDAMQNILPIIALIAAFGG
ncbi:SLBB domain-containing protein [Aquabacter spiritensis]|uniref:Protein involved in polysaccharide export with SLBB domain n=1 Tax=Aquabacter spiritensis TaxID=933073 RepID=A0A4R3M5R0_9HYPH|nr:SLBB domain-containing protein [Aquabacter spiritensis]TCT06575.1 protein involved in polysaccharide export with SLBB domain [Aquabacter spiritensis]